MSYFQGERFQRGAGLGSIFSKLFRTATPYLKKGAQYFGNELLDTTFNITDDIMNGEKIKNSVKKRFQESKSRIKNKTKEKFRKILRGNGKNVKIKQTLKRKKKKKVKKRKKERNV
jgi:hypothetical protein